MLRNVYLFFIGDNSYTDQEEYFVVDFVIRDEVGSLATALDEFLVIII